MNNFSYLINTCLIIALMIHLKIKINFYANNMFLNEFYLNHVVNK